VAEEAVSFVVVEVPSGKVLDDLGGENRHANPPSVMLSKSMSGAFATMGHTIPAPNPSLELVAASCTTIVL
jgi:hypothetical protein